MSVPKKPCAAVIGGTGFIGRHACAAFSRRGYGVLALARNLPRQALEAEFTPVDMLATPPERLAELLHNAGARVVVNAATDSWDGTDEEMTRSHVQLVELLLEALTGMPGRPRLVHLGSVHEYGDVPFGVAVTEDRTPAPATLYARTKLAGSQAVLDAARAGHIDAVVLRITNVCGPGVPRSSFLGKVATLLQEAAPGKPVRLAVAEAQRDFIDVRDVADAVVRAAETPLSGGTVNIGQGTAMAVRELLSLLVSASGVPPHLLREHDVPVGSNGSDWTQTDIRLARELLRWSPQVPLAQSIRDQWTATTEENQYL